MSDALTPTTRTQLRQNLVTHFSVDDLAVLCDDLRVDAETIPGKDQGKDFWAGHLVRYFELAGQISPLVDKLRVARPNVDWRFAQVGLTHTPDIADGKTALQRLNDEIETRKRTIRIFNISVPAVPVLIGLLAFIAASVFGVWFAVTPAMMDGKNGNFKIAVAQFGEEDAQGNVKASPSGAQLSTLVFERLRTGLNELPASLPKPLMWHDSLGLLQKRVVIGTVANEAEALKRAKEIGADILIYGNLKASQSPASFVPKFIIRQVLSNTDELDQIKGNHQLGEAIPVKIPLDLSGDAKTRFALEGQMNARMGLLSRLTIGLIYDLAGDPKSAASVFEAAASLNVDEKDGAEVLHYFTGKQYLFVKPRRLDDAQAEFEAAIKANANYARAYVGLGSTCYYRAQAIKPPNKRLDNDVLQHCLDAYNESLRVARDTNDRAAETQGLIGLGAARRLMAEAYVFANDYAHAEPLFSGAIETMEAAQTLADKDDHRLMGMLAENLGDAYQEKADLRLRQGNAALRDGDANRAKTLHDESKALFEQSKLRYQACQAEAAADQYDLFLNNAVKDALCVPHQKRADDSLIALQNLK